MPSTSIQSKGGLVLAGTAPLDLDYNLSTSEIENSLQIAAAQAVRLEARADRLTQLAASARTVAIAARLALKAEASSTWGRR